MALEQEPPLPPRPPSFSAPSLRQRLTASLLLDRLVLGALAASIVYATAVVSWERAGGCPAWLSGGASKVSSSIASVLGLLLAFRSNAAAGRWDTARRAWSDVHAQARVLIRVLATAPTIAADARRTQASHDLARARQAESLRLCAAFALALAIQLFGDAIPYPTTLSLDEKEEGDDEERSHATERVELVVLYSLLPPDFYPAQHKEGLQSAPRSMAGTNSATYALDALQSGLRRRHRGKAASYTAQGVADSGFRPEKDNRTISERAREKLLLHDADDRDFLAAILPRHSSPSSTGTASATASRGPANVALDVLTELQRRLDEMYAAGQSAPTTIKTNKSSTTNDDDDGAQEAASSKSNLHLAAPIYTHSTSALNALVARMTELEAIRDTTPPPTLRIHLAHVLVLHLGLVPLSLAPSLGWAAVPASGLVAYVLVALYSLAETLAQPFRRGGWNAALPLRRWAAEVVREAREAEAGWLPS